MKLKIRNSDSFLTNLILVVFFLLPHNIFAATGLLFNVSATGTAANVSINLCLNAKGPLSCQHYTVSALNLSITTTSPNFTYAYAGIKINTPGYTIANLGIDCTEYYNGYCIFSVSHTAAKSITINANSNTETTTQYGYVPNNETIYQCSLNTNGTFKTCAVTPSTGAPSWFPENVTFATVNGTQYAYVTSTTSVYQCSLNANGTFKTCAVTPSTGAPSWFPYDVAFLTVNGTQYAYVTSTTSVYRCSLNANGTFNACAVTPSTGAPSWQPVDVAFITVNGTQYAYVSDANNFYQCTLNSNGTFNTCAITPSSGAPGWDTPYGIASATVNGTQYAYVTDQSVVYQCTLNSNGTFNTCTGITSTIDLGPTAIAFTTVNGTQYAYVTGNIISPEKPNLYQCTLNSDGTFNVCSATPSTGSPVWAPSGLAFASVTTTT